MAYHNIPSDDIINQTAKALSQNGINAFIVDGGEQAKLKALELIPEGAEVMAMTSITLETIGLAREINESGRFNSVRVKLQGMDRKSQNAEMQKLGAAPEYATGSVHAVTQDGTILIASNTGSQLAAYVYGSPHVVWVVGAQKIVRDQADGLKRIFEYIVPQESVRARKQYNLPDTWNTYPSKILTVNREVAPNRISLILVKEILGF